MIGAEWGDDICVALDDGVRCISAIHNRKRKLCKKHYSRWQRNGSTVLELPGGGSLTKARRAEAMVNRQRQLEAAGFSGMCICTHAFLKHYAKNGGGCKELDCNCRFFESTNITLLTNIIYKMNRLGFTQPLNDTAWCKACSDFVRIGYWHDQMAMTRIKEHLRLNHLQRRKSRAV